MTIKPRENLCDFCGTCVAVCPTDAIELLEAQIKILMEKCILCLNCVQVCPLEVLEAADERPV